MIEKLADFIGKKRWKSMKKDYWLILFLVGILLLVVAMPMDCGKRRDTDEQGSNLLSTGESDKQKTGSNTEIYEQELEGRLAEVLSHMEGVGNVRVMISFQDTGEAIVEKDVKYSAQEQMTEEETGNRITDQQTESEEATVYDQEDKGGAPFVRKTKLPTIKGILILAEGGGDQRVITDISEAVEALFGLEPHKIKVVEMNQVQEGSE